MLNYHQVHVLHTSALRSGANTSYTTIHSSQNSTLFRGFCTETMVVPNTLSIDLEYVRSFCFVFWISASARGK